jgi:hypothetical protein
MTLFDARGLAVSAPDAAALALFETALIGLHGHRGDTGARIEQALARYPQMPIAHCLRAATCVLAGRFPADPALAESLVTLDRERERMTERERRHAAAAQAWLDGDKQRALERYGEIVIDYPRDSVALQVAHALDFRLGNREMLRDRVAQVLPRWDTGLPGYGYVLGMYAFGLEETGDYARAEAAARESLRFERDNASAIHVIAHCLEMQGRARSGIDWLGATRGQWGGNAGFAPHLNWHLALFHVDLDDTQAAYEIYRRELAPNAVSTTAELIDATALLWRLALRGLDLRWPWRDLAACWARKPLRGERAFNLIHALLAFGAAGDERDADSVVALLRHDAATQAASTAQDLALAVPLAEGLRAFSRGDYSAAVERIAAVRAAASRCGGSIAQCDLIHLTLLEAALRSRRSRLAEALASERTALRPESALNRRLFERARSRGGSPRPSNVAPPLRGQAPTLSSGEAFRRVRRRDALHEDRRLPRAYRARAVAPS